MNFLHRLYRAEGKEVCKQAPLSELKLPVVYATAVSRADSIGGFQVYSDDYVPLPVREYKESTYFCMEALPQARACGSCVAVGLMMRGLQAEDAIVPGDVATGKIVQFGAAFIAGGRLLMSIVMSEELDLSHPDHARLADVYYSRTRTHLQNTMRLVKEATSRAANAGDLDVLSFPETLYCKLNCVTLRVSKRWTSR